MLVDRDDYWLNSEYNQWITDPDDPEVKRARAERKRRGVKPPPNPILAPVAFRPKGMADKRLQQYMEALEPVKPETQERKVSAAEFARLLGA